MPAFSAGIEQKIAKAAKKEKNRANTARVFHTHLDTTTHPKPRAEELNMMLDTQPIDR